MTPNEAEKSNAPNLPGPSLYRRNRAASVHRAAHDPHFVTWTSAIGDYRRRSVIMIQHGSCCAVTIKAQQDHERVGCENGEEQILRL